MMDPFSTTSLISIYKRQCLFSVEVHIGKLCTWSDHHARPCHRGRRHHCRRGVRRRALLENGGEEGDLPGEAARRPPDLLLQESDSLHCCIQVKGDIELGWMTGLNFQLPGLEQEEAIPAWSYHAQCLRGSASGNFSIPSK